MLKHYSVLTTMPAQRTRHVLYQNEDQIWWTMQKALETTCRCTKRNRHNHTNVTLTYIHMCIYMYIYICEHIYIYMYISKHLMCTNIYVGYISKNVCTCTWEIHLCVFTYQHFRCHALARKELCLTSDTVVSVSVANC